MILVYIFGVIFGVFLLFWGFWALHKKGFPLDVIGGLCSILGLVMALLSVLLICVPHFFKGY